MLNSHAPRSGQFNAFYPQCSGSKMRRSPRIRDRSTADRILSIIAPYRPPWCEMRAFARFCAYLCETKNTSLQFPDGAGAYATSVRRVL